MTFITGRVARLLLLQNMVNIPTQNFIVFIKHLPYIHPFGTPLYWRNEASGKLQEAVLNFFQKQLKDDEFLILRAYLEYAINAPCWQDDTGDLEGLRIRIQTLKEEELGGWINDCLTIGLDLL